MQKIMVLFVLVSLAVLIGWVKPEKAFGADAAFEIILKDAFYGGLAGALVGTATLAFTDDPEDHLDRIAYGAAIGVLIGTVVGFAQTSKSLVQLENGRIAVGLPVPETRIGAGPKGSGGAELRLGLFSWSF
jgi:hypothetical protein